MGLGIIGIVRDNKADAADPVEVMLDKIMEARSANTEAGCLRRRDRCYFHEQHTSMSLVYFLPTSVNTMLESFQ